MTHERALILLIIVLMMIPTVACIGGGVSASGSAAPLPASGSVAGSPGTYTVQPGDTLAGIAARHGVTVQAMVDANKDTYPSLATNPGLIEVGWVLVVPESGSQGSTVVQGGETPSGASGAAAPAPASATLDVAAVEWEIFRLVNEERVKAGLHPLEWDPVLAEIARARSRDMVDRGYFSHYDPVTGEVLVVKMLAERGYPPGGENIGENASAIFALAHPTPTDLARDRVRSWINSSEHRENMLCSDYRITGVGIAVYPDAKEIVATQIFLR